MTSSSPLPNALFRSSPEDFVVEEIPAYAPSGKGEHLFVTFRKTGKNTADVLRSIAAVLEVDARGAGAAGMKDRHAVTTQTASFPVPMARDPAPLLATASIPGVEILSASRHENKLKPGHLIGNKFRIVLRGLDDRGAESVLEGLRTITTTGVPNAFGPQRFGRDGDNPERALAWIRGQAKGPRDRREQRLLFSALQSLMFNQVLEIREQDGTWASVLPGDLAKKHDTGGLFLVPAEGPDLADAVARALAGGISATGPLFGARMRRPEGSPDALERRVLSATLPDEGRLEALRHLGEGTRRSFRLMVSELTTETLPPTPSGNNVAVCFVLPKGGYATTVLARVCRLVETRGGAQEGEPPKVADDAAGPEPEPETEPETNIETE